ncbi:hypothetical protein FQN53_002064 [Emmonsiellopsis sp. PD_33]|nr:hypothetical protein FQN53_002064 [Emmonsiellopsis sp. PD_33]
MVELPTRKRKRIRSWINEVNDALFDSSEAAPGTGREGQAEEKEDMGPGKEISRGAHPQQQHLVFPIPKTCGSPDQSRGLASQHRRIPFNPSTAADIRFTLQRLQECKMSNREVKSLDSGHVLDKQLRSRPGEGKRAAKQSAKKGPQSSKQKGKQRAGPVESDNGSATGDNDNDDDDDGKQTSRKKGSATSTPSSSAIQQLCSLEELTTPKVQITPFSTQDWPGFVTEWYRQWVEVEGKPIPSELRKLIQKELPLEIIPGEANETQAGDEDASSVDYEQIWKALRSGYRLANEAYTTLATEEDWDDVVKILCGIFKDNQSKHGERGMMEVVSMQSISIAPGSLLPRVHRQTIRSRRIDLGIFYDRRNPRVSGLLNPIRSEHMEGQGSFSPTQHAKGLAPQVVSIEIKSPDGSAYTSSMQLVTWLAALLERLRELQAQGRMPTDAGAATATGPENKPLHAIGISVVGHHWLIFVAVKNAENGNVAVYGPANMGDTMSIKGTLHIIHMLLWLKKWGEEEYWPWLEQNIIAPLRRTDDAQPSGSS